jgi:hypothetical protein
MPEMTGSDALLRSYPFWYRRNAPDCGRRRYAMVGHERDLRVDNVIRAMSRPDGTAA